MTFRVLFGMKKQNVSILGHLSPDGGKFVTGFIMLYFDTFLFLYNEQHVNSSYITTSFSILFILIELLTYKYCLFSSINGQFVLLCFILSVGILKSHTDKIEYCVYINMILYCLECCLT